MNGSSKPAFDWEEKMPFPDREQIQTSNRSLYSRSPYLAGWVQCGREAPPVCAHDERVDIAGAKTGRQRLARRPGTHSEKRRDRIVKKYIIFVGKSTKKGKTEKESITKTAGGFDDPSTVL